MKLQRIEIYNFRFIHGIRELFFSNDPKKPLTIFIGENTGGKSTIFNAIYWCFFGELMPGSDRPHEIINDTAKKQGERDTFVTIDFTHNEKQYQIKRESGDLTNFSIDIIENGNFSPESNPVKFVNNLIPSNLREWFFYDGESSLKDRITLEGGSEIKKSLRTIQGFTFIDQLKEDINKVIKQKNLESAKFISGNSERLKSAEDKIKNLEHIIPGQKNELDVLNNELTDLENKKRLITKQLQGLPKSSELENRKSNQLKQKGNAKTGLENAEIKQAQMLANFSSSMILKKEVLDFENLEKDEDTPILVEAPHGDTLLNNIIKNKKCICGTDVLPNSKEFENIQVLKENSKPDSFNRRVHSVELVIEEMKTMSSDYQDNYDDIDNEIKRFNTQIEECDYELKLIEDDYKKITDEAVQKLRKDESSLESKIKEKISKIAVKKAQYELNLEKERELSSWIERITNEGGKKSKINDLILKLQKLEKYVDSKLSQNEALSLSTIFNNLNDLVQQYFYDPVDVDGNTETVEVSMFKKGTDVAYKHTVGSMELTKYFFLSSVLGIAGESSNTKKSFLSEPTAFPLLMDAPFTSFSAIFSKNALSALISNIDQLIFLALPDKFISYQDGIKDQIGKAYLIIKKVASDDKNIKKLQNDKNDATYKIYNKAYSFIEYNSDISTADIREINL